VFTLYYDPKDYPGEWVVRRHVVKNGEAVADSNLSARGATKEDCLRTLYVFHPETRFMTWLDRCRDDDPCIAGVLL
jgi:hypothetical protein